MRTFRASITLILALPVSGHLALWHDSAYGIYAHGNTDSESLAIPIKDHPLKSWWFRYRDKPPQDGVMMELPAGGTFTEGFIACNINTTTYCPEGVLNPISCPGDDMDSWTSLHLSSDQGVLPPIMKGTALAIAYKSDPYAVKPEDFVVISTNRESPYSSNVSYDIPKGLPKCPAGGCHCAWGWIHGPEHGGKEMYHVVYRCTVRDGVKGATLPSPKVPVNCKDDTSRCVTELKQMIYFGNSEGDNVEGDEDNPPYYNEEWGYTNGAQSLGDMVHSGSGGGTDSQTDTQGTGGGTDSQTDTQGTTNQANAQSKTNKANAQGKIDETNARGKTNEANAQSKGKGQSGLVPNGKEGQDGRGRCIKKKIVRRRVRRSLLGRRQWDKQAHAQVRGQAAG